MQSKNIPIQSIKPKLTKSEYYSAIKESHRFILDYQLEYPINISLVAQKSNAKLVSYSEFATRANVALQDTIQYISEFGFSFWAHDSYHIIYNDSIKSKGSMMWTIMHEIVHIYHNDIQKDGTHLPKLHEKTKREALTDLMTCKILAPDCLLDLYAVTSIDEIMALTGLSYTAAEIALNAHMKKRRSNNRVFIETEPFVIDLISRHYNPLNVCFVY